MILFITYREDQTRVHIQTSAFPKTALNNPTSKEYQTK